MFLVIFSCFYMINVNYIKWKVVSFEGREVSKGKFLIGFVFS